MLPEAKKLLWDALQAAGRIERFITGKTFESYQEDEQLRSAVERQFEIIGEALAQLRNIDPETAAAIIQLPRIVGFRNMLIHGYAVIDHRIVWGVVETRLSPLREELKKRLDEE